MSAKAGIVLCEEIGATDVDTSSRPTVLSLCSGIGGLDLGLHWAGWRTVCYIERNPYRQQVLIARMRDSCLDEAPIWDDVTTFDGRPWRGTIHLLSAGFPCQPFSTGGDMAGEADARYLWPSIRRIIGEVEPPFILLENVPGILMVTRGRPAPLGRILGELTELGYDAEWTTLSAAEMGAPHLRRRVFIVAYPRQGRRERVLRGHLSDCPQAYRHRAWLPSTPLATVWDTLSQMEERVGEPAVFRSNDGLSQQVERLAAVGEAVLPQIAHLLGVQLLTAFKREEHLL